jgi:hypothetical protein
MAEARARLGNADEVREIEVLAHVRQQVEWKVGQGCRGHRAKATLFMERPDLPI